MKRSAFVEFALNVDLTAVFLHNAVDNRQAEPGSVILGGKERIENVGEVFAFDPFATVSDRDAEDLRPIAVGLSKRGHPFRVLAGLGRHNEIAAVFHRVHGIDKEIQEDLLQLVGVGAYCINIRLP